MSIAAISALLNHFGISASGYAETEIDDVMTDGAVSTDRSGPRQLAENPLMAPAALELPKFTVGHEFEINGTRVVIAQIQNQPADPKRVLVEVERA